MAWILLAWPRLIAPASAQDVEEFYKNRTLTLIVSSDAGSRVDAYSRSLARHMTPHLPGRPDIVVRSMPGRLNAINYIANVAPRDGSVFADTDATLPFYTLLEEEDPPRFDPRLLNWIGSISKQTAVCVAWHQSPFKTLEDAMVRPMLVGAVGAAERWASLPRMYNLLSGSKFTVIGGFSAAGVLLSMERGEVDGACATYNRLLAVKADWLRDSKLTFLVQFGREPAPALARVPLALEGIEDDVDRAAMELALLPQITGRPYVAPPHVPPDRLAALRAAFDATMIDPAYLADAQSLGLNVDPLTSGQFASLLDRAYAADLETLIRARWLVATTTGRRK